MTLHQLHLLKRWHQAHKKDHPVEYHVYDLVLTAWVAGWAGAPAALLLEAPLGLFGCGLLFLAPAFYIALRSRLHQAGRLRCDWLGALPAL
ncbi:hypothetical protein OOT46_12585 [Aquabacterium sp. A7-Y]|uniref:hypothetical protein n=1 Tax=Aquabacterium sp. A7-Y TaxID=1349605 RepID=UPI00223DAEB9|nr:hypothetical protein [Aquabacterium sp. A7-Y]MCW7538680.1 hypothetical protein [Aquabacterium sp. A7-Y]